MTIGFRRKLCLLGVGLFFCLAAAQQDESVQAADTLFIQAASASNVYEIGAARHAVQQAQAEEVKTLAQQIIDDHTKAASQLVEVAEGMDVQPNADMTEAQQLNVNALAELNGADLDTAYLEQQVLAHQEAVSLFETASGMVQSQDLSAFIEQTLPALQEHLQMAQELLQTGRGN